MDGYGDNGFFGFMNRFGDIVFLNVMFLITCIPVVTIGNALTALHSVSLKMARGEEGYVVRGYFKAFKENLKQGLIVGIFLEIILAVLTADVRILFYSTESYRDMGLVITVTAIVFLVMIMQYLFPLMARYENGIKNTVINAVLLAISRLPYTLLLIVLAAVPVILVYITPYAWIYVIFAGISTSALLQGKVLNRIFHKIEGVSTEENM